MKEAMFYKTNKDLSVSCLLCPHNCKLKSGQTGFCLNRQNINGKLFSLNYGKVSAINLDPIEKKPLYHYFPGSPILSFGTYGCTLDCSFCQNSTIARSTTNSHAKKITPKECIKTVKDQNGFSIAYTYNEPYTWFEHMLETAILAKKEGIKNVLITNGYYNDAPWQKLAPYIDAMNIDLKGDDAFYKKLCKGDLEPVLNTIKDAYSKNIHIEITNLVVTDKNNNLDSFNFIIDYLSKIDKNIPLHISRYFPMHNLNNKATPPNELHDFYNKAMEKLNFVYVGNITGFGEDTICPECNKTLIKRSGYTTKKIKNFINGRCPGCGFKVYGQF